MKKLLLLIVPLLFIGWVTSTNYSYTYSSSSLTNLNTADSIGTPFTCILNNCYISTISTFPSNTCQQRSLINYTNSSLVASGTFSSDIATINSFIGSGTYVFMTFSGTFGTTGTTCAHRYSRLVMEETFINSSGYISSAMFFRSSNNNFVFQQGNGVTNIINTINYSGTLPISSITIHYAGTTLTTTDSNIRINGYFNSYTLSGSSPVFNFEPYFRTFWRGLNP